MSGIRISKNDSYFMLTAFPLHFLSQFSSCFEISSLNSRHPYGSSSKRQTGVSLCALGFCRFASNLLKMLCHFSNKSSLRGFVIFPSLCAEPHFLHAIEYGNYVYFFFSEIAVEYTTLGKVRKKNLLLLPSKNTVNNGVSYHADQVLAFYSA